MASMRDRVLARHANKHQTASKSVGSSSDSNTDGVGGKVVRIPADVKAAAENQAELETEQSISETITTLVTEFNKTHFVAHEGTRTAVFREGYDHELGREKLDPITTESFKVLYAPKKIVIPNESGSGGKHISIAKIWLEDERRRTYEKGFAFVPAGDVPDGVYNLWRGFGCPPDKSATSADVKPFLLFLYKTICAGNQAVYKYVIGWLAHAVQHPERQAEVALVLMGGKGTGKGFFGRMGRDLFGTHGMHALHPKHLTGNFNAHLRQCLFMFVDESFFAGDRAGSNVLKGLITEDQVTIEKKGIDVFSARNRLKIVMATNEPHAVIASGDERRFCVLQVDEARKQDHVYFGELSEWWTSGGMGLVLGYLLSVDISKFNIRKAPNTAALEKQKIESLGPLDAWLYDKLQQGEWETKIGRNELVGQFSAYVHTHGLRYVNTTATSVGMGLRNRMTVSDKQESKGHRRRLWILPELDDAREQFALSLGLSLTTWDEV